MMPKKPKDEKRSQMIGVKLDIVTRRKLQYLAESEGESISTFVFNLIQQQIEQYTKIRKINWEEELNDNILGIFTETV